MSNFVSITLLVLFLCNIVTTQKFSDALSGATAGNLESFESMPAVMPNLTKNNFEQTTIPLLPNLNSSQNQRLPTNWEEFCLLKPNTDNLFFQCKIGKQESGKWRLTTLRNWIANSNTTYSFEITCIDGANISVPWPIKASNLVQIIIKDCLIVDYFNDYNNIALISKIPDQLEVLSFDGARIFIKFMEILPIMMNVGEMPKDFDCGHEETLKVYVYKNMSYEFSQSEIEYFKNIQKDKKQVEEKPDVLKAGKKLLDGTRQIEHKCKFTKLEYVDQSISGSRSKFHLSLLTENSFFPNLKTYNLSNTGMRVLNLQFREWWTYFPKLETLDLSNNFINKIDLDKSSYAWKAVTSNLTINLRNNNISSLTIDDFELMVLQSNIFVQLEGNPLDCKCSPDMLNLLKMVQSDLQWTDSPYRRYEYLRHIKCTRPKIASGRELITLDETTLSCPVKLEKVVEYEEGYLPLPLVIILCVTVVVLLIVVIILAKFRREIRILTYTRFNIILPCQPLEKYEGKIYDAFVSYSNAEEEWVSETFQKLEKAESGRIPAFKFCLHHRNFIPGKSIFDNVIDSVEASRHTVIILSKNFLKSNFCLYEFHEAFQQSIIERKRHLLVVLMEEIPEKDLPNDLRRCLKTFTYIKKDDTIFTDRLVYALSYKGRHRSLTESDVDNNKRYYPSLSNCESVTSDSSNQSPSIMSVDSSTPIFPDTFCDKREDQELYV